MWLQLVQDFIVFGGTFFVFCLCGLIGILVDIDHPISYYLIPKWSGRFLHTPVLVAGCCVLCCCGAYIGGLYLESLLAIS